MSSDSQVLKVQQAVPPQNAKAKILGHANENELMTVTVKLTSKNTNPSLHQFSYEDFEAVHGADPVVVSKVEEFAKANGLVVLDSSSKKRHVVLSGKVSAMEKAFGVELLRFERKDRTYRSHSTDVKLDTDWAGSVEAVLGLCNRPVAKPHFQYAKKNWLNSLAAYFNLSTASPQPMTPMKIAELYDFPTGLGGTGQTVAIIELGGGYIASDLSTYFSQMGVHEPNVSEVSVLGGTNSPGGEADGEVMLDIEVVGCVAPEANIVVYFTPNTTQGFVQAITEAAHDTVNKPSVISISWGGPENSWSSSDMTAMTNAIRDAVILGVTVTVAAGDNGSSDGEGGLHVDFPASSPYALACGGTRLIANGNEIGTETVWNDGNQGGATGGGLSAVYPQPSYQFQVVKHSVRGVPDVAGNGDPESGYIIRVDGQTQVVGGTSAVAPLWAGLVALMNQKLGKRLGFMHPALYSEVFPGGFHQITQGNNGAYFAHAGWNACSGLGSPDGNKILSVFEKS